MKGNSLVHAMLDRSVVFGIGLMIALLGVGAVGSYRNIQSVQEHSQRLTHTYEVDQLTASLRHAAIEAVVQERSFQIIGKEAAAAKSRDLVDQMFVQFEELRRKTVDNEDQQRRLTHLQELLTAFRNQLLQALVLRSTGANTDELALVSEAIDDHLERIRDQIATIRGEEVRLLQEREAEVGAALRTALFSGVILFGLGLALFMGIIELIRRNAAFQRRQQERLFAEREQLAVTLASIDDAVISIDRQGRIIHWNGQAEHLTGTLRETAVGLPVQNMLRLTDELTDTHFTVPLDDILKTGVSPRFDAPLLITGTSGQANPVALRVSPILDNAGGINGAVLILRQLTEERRAELVRTERARILSIRADVGLIISHAGRTEEQLQQCLQTVGQQLSAVAVGLWSTTSNNPDDSLKLKTTWRQSGWSFAGGLTSPPPGSVVVAALETRNYVQQACRINEIELLSESAPEMPAEIAAWACPLTIEDRVLGVLTVYTLKPLSDHSASELSLVTAKLAQFIERRALEEARQESEELFRTLANSIPQLAWMARPDGFVFWYNQRWFNYTGTTFEEMQGSGWHSVHDQDELPHVLASLQNSFATGEPWEDTFPLRRHDGEYRWHLSRMVPVRDDEGRIRLWFGTNTDVTEQRNAENRLRRVIDSIFAFVGIIAPDGTLIEVNQAPLSVAGISREEVIGREFWNCHWWSHDEDVRNRVRQAFEQARAGQLVRYDEEIHLEGTTRITMDLMLQPVFDDGKLVFVIPSGVDVTARKQAEERLALSEEFLRSVLDALASHIAVLDDRGTILMVNRAWREFAERNQLESSNYAVGQNYLEVCSPSMEGCPGEAEMAANGIREVIHSVRPWFTMEYPCHSPVEKRWFQMRVDRFTSFNSTRVVVSHENITPRVLSKESTRRWSAQQQRLAEIAIDLSAAENMHAALNVVTAGARRLIDSAAAEIVYARSGDEQSHIRAVSLDGENDVFAIDTPQVAMIGRRVRVTNRPLRLTATASTETPTEDALQNTDILSCLAAPLTARDGRNIGLIQLRGKRDGEYTADDEAILIQLAQMVSVALERARLYDEILAADQRKDQFLATLAHELRNPLSALTSGTQLILMQPQDVEHVTSTAALVSRQCTHLKQLVDDLLDVSRISRGKLNLQMTPASLQEIVQHAIETAQSAIQSGNHHFTTQITTTPLYVQGDAVRLAQVVSNLLVNAAKYTPEGGRIELELGSIDHQAVIVVRDNGIGIPKEMADRIFELFTQVDSSHSRSQGGLGIGLTLARTLVTMHDGQIEVTSPGVNQGSVFTVRLPLISVTSEQIEQPHPSEQQTSIKTHRILIVDDNRAAVFLLARLLSTMGHTVQTASDGQTALAAITKFKPAIVISDIGMPDMNGYELAHRILQLDLSPPPILVALTGYGQATDRQAAFDAGFRHHLTKPIGLADLDSLMQSLGPQGDDSLAY